MAASRFTANVVAHATESDLRQPRARILRQAIARPLRRLSERCLLHGVLRGREVAESPDNGAEHLRCQLAQERLDRGF
jgi:hypothetical protein